MHTTRVPIVDLCLNSLPPDVSIGEVSSSEQVLIGLQSWPPDDTGREQDWGRGLLVQSTARAGGLFKGDPFILRSHES